MSKLTEALTSVLPVFVIVLVLSFTPLAPLSGKERIIFTLCALFLVIGIGLFNLGADLAMSPIGRHVGEGLTKSGRIRLLFAACFLMGVLITVAEPDLSVLAGQISNVVNPLALIASVGIGVGLFLMLAVLRIVTKTDLTAMLLFFYMLMFAFASLLAVQGGKAFLPLAFDSGGVTTGPITVPFIMALGIGIAQTIGGRNSGQNSFGLILAVLILSLTASGEIHFPLPDYSMEAGLGWAFLHLLLETGWDVAKSLLLMLGFFFILQKYVLHLPQQKIVQILFGVAFAFVGLVTFLMAVTIGFMPVGYKIGSQMAQGNSGILILFGFIIGMVVVLAEPAVHVLNQQVEEVTNGAVRQKQMMIALSVGVGVSIGLSVLRLVLGFSLLYYLIPGYLISLGLSFLWHNETAEESMKNIKAIFFDFDDTLGNREVYAYNCYKAILKENTAIQDPVRFEAILQDCMLWDEKGNVNKNYVKDMLKKAWHIELPMEDFNTYWDSRLWEFTELLPDARETLEELKKTYKIGIITNGPSAGQRNKLKQAGIVDLFDEDMIIVSGEWPFAKPDVRLFHLACERAGVRPEEAVHVGDLFSRDVIGAYNAGMTPVWIWTQGERKNESGVITIHFLKELLNLF